MRFKATTGEKIQLEHSQGKKMPKIDKQKYETMKKTMLAVLEGQELTHPQLHGELLRKLKGKFEGDIGWYMEGVKLDLEAKKIIERIESQPQQYRLT